MNSVIYKHKSKFKQIQSKYLSEIYTNSPMLHRKNSMIHFTKKNFVAIYFVEYTNISYILRKNIF